VLSVMADVIPLLLSDTVEALGGAVALRYVDGLLAQIVQLSNPANNRKSCG
jgi:hypothetical protein